MPLTKIEAQFILDSIPKLKERVKVESRALLKWGDVTSPQCRYRVDGDANNTAPENCCFVGVLIPPDKYKRSFEGKVVFGNEELVEALIGHRSTVAFMRVLDTLQDIHDTASEVDTGMMNWHGRFEEWVNWATNMAHAALAEK